MTAKARARIAAGLEDQRQVGLLDGGRAVDVDHHQLGAALLACPRHVRHDVDLGGDGIGAPHHDEVGVLHLARIGPDQLADAGQPAQLGRRHADGGLLARIAHDVAQAVEAIALQDAHVAAGVVRPDRLRPRALGDAREVFRDLVQRRIPADRLELDRRPSAPLRRSGVQQPVRVLDPLGVAGDLGAHHAQGVAVVARARDAPDAAVGQHRHLQRAGARAIVRAGGLGDASHQLLHEFSLAPTGVRLVAHSISVPPARNQLNGGQPSPRRA